MTLPREVRLTGLKTGEVPVTPVPADDPIRESLEPDAVLLRAENPNGNKPFLVYRPFTHPRVTEANTE